MNKLTTIKTITKAAPLALLAVVLSGSAFADPGDNNGKKGNRTQGSKLSLNVSTTCELVPRAGAQYDDYTNPVLIVETVVDSSDSGDDGIGASSVKSKKAQAVAKKGKNSRLIGEEKDLLPVDVDPDPVDGPAIVTYTQMFDVCDDYDDGYGTITEGLQPSDKGVSAVATLVVDDGENMTSFASQCENIDPYPETEEDEDGVDQSNFDIGTDAMPPYEYPVVCSNW
jgi:hypothetical protein